MSEDGKAEAGAPAAGQGQLIAAWAGGVAFLGLLAIVLLYVYGDPRPTGVDADKIGGVAPAVPSVEAGAQYYRIRAEYIPLESASETSDPIGRLWASVFGDAVACAGRAAVQLRLSHPDPLRLPKDEDGYLLLDTWTGMPAVSAVTPFVLRRENAKVELRLDVRPGDTAEIGAVAAFLRGMGNSGSAFSGWISVFADGIAAGPQVLGAKTSIQSVRDFSGRAIGAVRIGVEARDSIMFEQFLSRGGLKDLFEAGATREALREAVLALIQRNVPTDFNGPEYKARLIADVSQLFAAEADGASCRGAYAALTGDMGLSSADAAAIAALIGLDPASMPPAGHPLCDDPVINAAAARLGLPDRLAGIATTMAAKPMAKSDQAGGTSAAPSSTGRAPREGRYVCLDVSGPRISGHCAVLNQIASEWRGGAKFLQMDASRQYIDARVGLEEPTSDMRYDAVRFGDRRQLLIHVALSRIENFACFRMTRQNPDYFEAMLVMRDPGERGGRRVDVFEFAFDSDGRIARIRRRAALPSDIDAAASLPETSRCRREFLDAREAELRGMVGDYWNLQRARG